MLDDEAKLPEGASVVVEVLSEQGSEVLHPDIVRFTGIIPRDVAASVEYRDALQAKHQ